MPVDQLPLPELSAGDLLPLPHLSWPSEGEDRSALLAAETRALLIRYSERKEERGVDADAAVRAVGRLMTDVFTYLAGASGPLRARLAEWTGSMFQAMDSHRDHGPDPFDGLSGLVDPPAWLGPGSLVGWPVLMGRAVARAEEDLGRPRRRRKVDARSWAALVGLAYLWSRDAFAAVRPGLRTVGREAGPGLDHDGILAGGALLVNQRAVVLGYRQGRSRR